MAIKEEERQEFAETKVDNGINSTDVNVRTGMTNDQFDLYQKRDVNTEQEFRDDLYYAIKHGDTERVKELTGWTRDANRPDFSPVSEMTKETQENANKKQEEEEEEKRKRLLAEQNARETGAEGDKPVDPLLAFMKDPFGLHSDAPRAPETYSGDSIEEAIRRGDWSAAARIMNAMRAREENEKQDFSGDGYVAGSRLNDDVGVGYGAGEPDMYGGYESYDDDGNWQYTDQWGGVYDDYGYTSAQGDWTGTSGATVSAKEPAVINEADGSKTNVATLLNLPDTTPPADQLKMTTSVAVAGEQTTDAVDGVKPTTKPSSTLAADASASPGAAVKDLPHRRPMTAIEKAFRDASVQLNHHDRPGSTDLRLTDKQTDILRQYGEMKRKGQDADAFLNAQIAREQKEAGVAVTAPVPSTTAGKPAAPETADVAASVAATVDATTDIKLDTSLANASINLTTPSLQSSAIDYGIWDDDPMYWNSDWAKDNSVDNKAWVDDYNSYYDTDGGYWDDYGYNDKNGGYTYDDVPDNGTLAGGFQDKNGNFVDKAGNLYLDGNYSDKPDALAANAPEGGWKAALQKSAADGTTFKMPDQTTASTLTADATTTTPAATTTTQTVDPNAGNFSQFVNSSTSFLTTSEASKQIGLATGSNFFDMSQPITGASTVWGTKFFDPATPLTTAPAANNDVAMTIPPTNPYYKAPAVGAGAGV